MKLKSKELLLSSILITITALSAVSLTSTITYADDSVVDEINITVPVSCTLSGTGMDSHSTTINNGTYTADIGTTTLKAFCNDSEGFAIYAAGYTGSEIGATNSNKLVGTSASGNATIDTGTATTAGNPDISNWAMKLTLGTDSGDTTGTNALAIDSAPNVALPSQAEQGATAAPFSNYHVVPNEYTKVAHKNSATNMDITTGGATLTTAYAAYISKTQPADTYSGQVIYTLVHPSSAAAPLVCNPSGTTIGTNTSTDIVCMQDVSSTNKSSILSSMTSEIQYTLVDRRDEKTYTIAKLADNNIWMTQNLDLDLDSTKTYTNLDTDLGWNASTNSYDTANWTPLRSTYSSATKTWCQSGTWSNQYNICQNNNTPESYDPGDLYWNGVLGNNIDWNAYHNSCTWDATMHELTCDETKNPTTIYATALDTTPQYYLGNFYNWTAAVASNDSSIYYTYTNTQVNQSICPAGWTLPVGGYYQSPAATPDQSFQHLVEQYGWSSSNSYKLSNNKKIWESPIFFSLSGRWYGILDRVGSFAGFWSSVPYNSDTAYSLVTDSDDYIFPDNSIGNGGGNIVRCVAR